MVRMWKGSIWYNKSCLSNDSILMYPGHSHCCITIYRACCEVICETRLKHFWIIKSWCICWIIWSWINCKIISIHSRQCSFWKHVVWKPHYIFYKLWVIIINIIWINVSSISFIRLWRPILYSNFWPIFSDTIWKSKMFSTKTILLIIITIK